MSLVKANSVQIGQSATASQNFTITTPTTPDGSLKISRGNAGATTSDVLVVAAADAGVTLVGTVNAGVFNSTSDVSKKTDITYDIDGLSVVNKLKGAEFTMIDSGKKSSGVIAQDIENVLPWLVDTDANGVKSVNYAGLCAYLINAINQLSKINSNQEVK